MEGGRGIEPPTLPCDGSSQAKNINDLSINPNDFMPLNPDRSRLIRFGPKKRDQNLEDSSWFDVVARAILHEPL